MVYNFLVKKYFIVDNNVKNSLIEKISKNSLNSTDKADTWLYQNDIDVQKYEINNECHLQPILKDGIKNIGEACFSKLKLSNNNKSILNKFKDYSFIFNDNALGFEALLILLTKHDYMPHKVIIQNKKKDTYSLILKKSDQKILKLPKSALKFQKTIIN